MCDCVCVALSLSLSLSLCVCVSGAAACSDLPREHKQWLLECIYTPVETELIRAARHRGLLTITGDRLNLHQFLRQFELVTGLQPKFRAAEAFFRALLKVASESRPRI